ncbi:hypothetical protein [Inhella sp.]|uniref:hypothetical protein n=1 Tax=Inhella sp. TaxID=1921806 RepID=UPI0035B25719
MARTESRLFLWLLAHPLLSFLAMTLGFLLFAGVTLDLARVLLQNLRFLSEHGWDAVREAGLWQFAGLCLQAMLGLLGYLVFKFNEYVLVQWLARARPR